MEPIKHELPKGNRRLLLPILGSAAALTFGFFAYKMLSRKMFSGAPSTPVHHTGINNSIPSTPVRHSKPIPTHGPDYPSLPGVGGVGWCG